jgi:hypothetical protein
MQASKDQNLVSSLLAVSSSDGVTPVTLYADPTTHRLLTAPVNGLGTVASAQEFSRSLAAADGAVTYAHGLGVVPKLIRVTFSNSITTSGNNFQTVLGTYDGTHVAGRTSVLFATNTAVNVRNSQIGGFRFFDSTSGGSFDPTYYSTAVPTFDATNVTLTWTKTNYPTGTVYFTLEAFG